MTADSSADSKIETASQELKDIISDLSDKVDTKGTVSQAITV